MGDNSPSPQVTTAQIVTDTFGNPIVIDQTASDKVVLDETEVRATAASLGSDRPEVNGVDAESCQESVGDAMDMSDTGSEEGEINDSPSPQATASSPTSTPQQSARGFSVASDVQNVADTTSNSSTHGRPLNSHRSVEGLSIGSSVTEQPVAATNADVLAQQENYQGELEDQDMKPSDSEDSEPLDVAGDPQPGSDSMEVSDDDHEIANVVRQLPPTAVVALAEPASSLATSRRTSPAPHNTQDTQIADDLAPELQPEQQNQPLMVNPVRNSYRGGYDPDLSQAVHKPLPTAQSHFKPYESPLKIFKAYRYHSQYPSEVPGGFRSMTYSHKIDQERPLCPFEAMGGACNDAACDFQHFRSMGLSGALESRAYNSQILPL